MQRQILNRFGGDAHEITRREDGAFIYYDLDLGDGAARYHGSSFHRSFPVPPEVDGRDFKMEQEGRKIIIKFPKRAA